MGTVKIVVDLQNVFIEILPQAKNSPFGLCNTDLFADLFTNANGKELEVDF